MGGSAEGGTRTWTQSLANDSIARAFTAIAINAGPKMSATSNTSAVQPHVGRNTPAYIESRIITPRI